MSNAVRQSFAKTLPVYRGMVDRGAPSSARWYLLAAAFLFGAMPALLVDLTLARNVLDGHLPGDLRRLLHWSEAFAHGLGVAIIAVVALLLDTARRRYWPRVLCIAFGGGLLANGIKLLVGRYRPNHFSELEQGSVSVTDTFAGLLPSLATGLDHAVQSFPSAHTATACGFAVGLARVYPRARWLFACLATLAAAQRVSVGAHFLSDVLAGVAVGMCAAAVAFEPRLLGGWFDRLEQTGGK